MGVCTCIDKDEECIVSVSSTGNSVYDLRGECLRRAVHTNTIRQLVKVWTTNQFAKHLNVYCELPKWDVSGVASFYSTFQNAVLFDADLGGWDTSSATDLSGTFSGAAAFRGKGLAKWDVSGVKTFYGTFRNAALFDADLVDWDASSATDLRSTFSGAVVFQGKGLAKWGVAGVKTFCSTFQNAVLFDADLGGWDASSATDLGSTFSGAAAFTGKGVEKWGVALVKTFCRTFQDAALFDADLGDWDTSSATDLRGTFSGAAAFRGTGLHTWDISLATTLDSTFKGASAFNGNVSAWQVSSVVAKEMALVSTFERASAFNIDINGWDVGKVGGAVNNAFAQAVALNQDLEAWVPQFAKQQVSAARLAANTGYRRPSAAWAANASVLLHQGLPPADVGTDGSACGSSSAPCTHTVYSGTTYTMIGPLDAAGLDTAAAFTSFGGTTYAATRFRVTVEPRATRDLVFHDAATGTWVLKPLQGTHNGSSYTVTLVGTDTIGNGGALKRWRIAVQLEPVFRTTTAWRQGAGGAVRLEDTASNYAREYTAGTTYTLAKPGMNRTDMLEGYFGKVVLCGPSGAAGRAAAPALLR